VSRVYTGPQASEELLKREAVKFQMIHFAAPALLDDANAMYSHVLLSQSEENGSDDGLLEAWEMMKLDLRADLIVFSASETAVNRTSSGDSLAGLAWSLFVSGCPSSVVSRWRTDAAASDAMMTDFHRELQLLQRRRIAMPKGEALRRAAHKMLNSQYRHPFCWAGFDLVGRTR
jgi:CHAT domain-containing protein